MQPKVTVVVIAHEDVQKLEEKLEWLCRFQSYFNIEIVVYYSGMKFDTGWELVGITFNQPNRNDYGQEKAAHGLNAARGKYCCFMNIDDEYKENYLEEMVKALEENIVEVAYCNYTAKDGTEVITEPKIGSVTRGCIMVDSYFARSVGYNHRDYGADGKFVEELIAAGAKTVHVNKNLYTHK